MPRRSDHKDFEYSGGDDEYSNAFIEGVINTAPTKSSEMTERKSHSEQQAASDEWASNVYSKYNPDKYEDGAEKKGWSCASAWVAVFSVLLFLIGIGMFALGIVEEHHKQILPLCPGCKLFIAGVYIAGAALIILAIMGCLSAKTKFGCLSIPFAVLMLLIGIAFLCVGIAAVLFGTGAEKLNIESLWQNAVKDDPHFICSIQSDLQCSGYGNFCCFSNYSVNSSMTMAPATQAPAATAPVNGSMSASGSGSDADELCKFDSDCVPSTCCHSTSCVLNSSALRPDCTGTACTAVCQIGTVQCDGNCMCNAGQCAANVTGGGGSGPSSGEGPALGYGVDANNQTAEYCWAPTAEGHIPAGVITHCSDDCAMSNGYSTPCNEALQAKIKEYLVPVIAALFPLAILMIITGMAAIKMTCCPPKLE